MGGLHNRETDWGKVLRWVIVLPMFVFTLVFLKVFFIGPFNYLVGGIIPQRSDAWFIADRFYRDCFCMGFAIYVSCMTATSRRVTISIVYMILVLAMLPRQMEIVMDSQPFAVTEWKMTYWTVVYVASGVLPLMIMLGIKYWPKIVARKDATEPGSIVQ
jgi:hypothetical protein